MSMSLLVVIALMVYALATMVPQRDKPKAENFSAGE